MDKNGVSSILLTYKGKILLMHRDDSPLIQNPWRFIEGKKPKNKTFEQTICKKVEEETGLKLENVELLSKGVEHDEEKYFFHADLTDKEVNNIKREGILTLGFYSLKEMKKLALTESTKAFHERHREFLEQVPN